MEMFINCPNCGAPVVLTEKRCPYCETPYPKAMAAATPVPITLQFDGAQVVAALMEGIVTANEARAMLGLPPKRED